jgi:tetratricopeptide (TPR) repeat protein
VDAGRYVPDDSEAVDEIAGDVAVTLRVMVMAWNDVFRDRLGPAERSLVSEIRETRNRWAHQEGFDDDDLDRALDSIGRLLGAVGAVDQAKRIDAAKHRLRLKRYGAATTPENGPSSSAPEPEAEARSPEAQPAGRRDEADAGPAAAPTPNPSGRPADPAGDDAVVLAHLNKGVEYRRQEHFEHAMGEFEQALSINPERADAWFNRGMTWGIMGDHRRAITDFNRAIAIAPLYAEAYNCRGYAHFCLEDYRQAVEDLERASRLSPEDELIQGNLQQARLRFLQQPGNPDTARHGLGPAP